MIFSSLFVLFAYLLPLHTLHYPSLQLTNISLLCCPLAMSVYVTSSFIHLVTGFCFIVRLLWCFPHLNRFILFGITLQMGKFYVQYTNKTLAYPLTYILYIFKRLLHSHLCAKNNCIQQFLNCSMQI